MDKSLKIQELVGGILKKGRAAPLAADTPLAGTGLDSLSLLVLREKCEKEFGIFIPDEDWFGISTFSDLVSLVDSLSTADSPESGHKAGSDNGRSDDLSAWNPDDMVERLEIGMPLMGIGNLSESALLKHLGDVRWRHITRLTGVPSRDLLDDERNRLYPAFFYVELRFPESRPMGSFGENDSLVVMDTVKRFGLSILDGVTYLIPSERWQSGMEPISSLEDAARRGIPAVRMSNAFVMKFDGAEWLKRSRPRSGILEAVAELEIPPDSIDLSKQVQKGESPGALPAGSFALHDSEVSYEYRIQPDRDVNGVGLLYFANYPVFLDLAERWALKQTGLPWSDAAVNTRSLVLRKAVYLNNAPWHDSLEIRTRSWVRSSGAKDRQTEESGAILLTSEQRMYRQSDGRMMCVCWSEKLVTGAPEGLLQSLSASCSSDLLSQELRP